MIKQMRASYFHNFKNAQYCALSDDPIPDDLENGDEVYIIDQGKIYYWDESSSSLYEYKGGRGGSGGSSSFVPCFGSLATVSLGTTWSGDDPYVSTVTVTGYTVTTQTMVSVLPSSDVVDQMLADGITNIFITNNDGVLTATVIGATPTVPMTLQVLCTESDISSDIAGLPSIVGSGIIQTVEADNLTDAVNILGEDVDDLKNAISELSGEVDAMHKVSSNIFDPDTETKVIGINSSGKCLFYVDQSTAYRGIIFEFESTKSIGYKFTYSGTGISSVKLASYEQRPTSNSDDFVALRQITGTQYNDDRVGLLPHDTGAAYYVFDVAFSSGASYDTIFNAIRSNLYIFESDATAQQDVDWDSINYVPHMILDVPMEALPEELTDEIDNKVDKILGKGLSQNDFSNTDVEKLNNCYTELFGESETIIKYGDEDIISGSWASTADGTIKTTDNTRIYDVTDYIPCTYGDKLYLCEVQSICFYDSAKSFLPGGGITISNIAGYTGNGLQNDYTVSLQNAAYMRVNFYNSNYSSQMVGGRYAVCRRNDNPHIILNLGDSLFGLNPKPYDISTYVQDITGVKTANCGFGGTRAATHSNSNYNLFSLYSLADAIYSEDFSAQDAADFSILGSGYYYKYNLRTLESIDFDDVRLITLAYGTNDWNANIPIDNADDPDDYTTFKGALRYSISKIQSKYPDIMIVLLSPIYRTFDSHTVDSNTKTNSAGKTLIDYVDAVKEVAAEYELPFVDNYRNSGINIYNSTVFLRDETHLTFDNGANRIGTITGRELSKFLSR